MITDSYKTMSDSESTSIEPGLKVTVEGLTYWANDGDVIGREGNIASHYFEDIPTISRIHVRVHKKEGRWYISVPSAVSNSTMLDGTEVNREELQLVNGPRVLKLAADCIVHLDV